MVHGTTEPEMIETIFWISTALLYYIYDGYKRILSLIRLVVGQRLFFEDHKHASPPAVTVLITAWNERVIIEQRIKNILESDYPEEKLDVMVASDGSTDGTDDIVKGMNNSRVKLFRPEQRSGKTGTQNKAIPLCSGEIIVFTDAGTTFAPDFISNIAQPFANPVVGAVDGRLLFETHTDGSEPLAKNQGRYWKYELDIRKLESELGILAVVAGACFALRKKLFVPMPESTGEDCIIPLDTVLQKYKVVHNTKALAFDTMDKDSSGELRTRERMVLRNWQGTWSRPALLNPFRNPGYSFALWSHKLLRWLSPLFLIASFTSSFILAISCSSLICAYCIAATLYVLLFAAGITGFVADKKGFHVPMTSTAFSFLLANVGFMRGLLMALRNKRIHEYRQ